jgi:hypothetical protein
MYRLWNYDDNDWFASEFTHENGDYNKKVVIKYYEFSSIEEASTWLNSNDEKILAKCIKNGFTSEKAWEYIFSIKDKFDIREYNGI